MRQILPIICFAALLPTAAHATCCREQPRWYGGVSGSISFLDGYQSTYKNVPAGATATNSTLDFSTGFGVGGQVGYRILPEFRAELETRYYRNEVDSVTNTFNTLRDLDNTRQTSNTFMLNAYYDFRNRSYFTPYVGAGLGAAYVKAPLEAVRYVGGTLVERQRLRDWVPAWQFMAGVSHELIGASDFAPIEIYLGYRYLDTAKAEIEFDTLPGVKKDFENSSHNLDLGLNMAF